MYSSTLSFTSASDEMFGQRHVPVALHPGVGLGTHCTGGWVVPRAGAEYLGPIGVRSPHRPAHRESLYRLSYRGRRAVLKVPLSL